MSREQMRTIGRVGEPLRAGDTRRSPRLSVRQDGTAKVTTRAKRVPTAVWWVVAAVVIVIAYLGFAVDRATEPAEAPSAASVSELEQVEPAFESSVNMSGVDPDAPATEPADPDAPATEPAGPAEPTEPAERTEPAEGERSDRQPSIDPDAPAQHD